MSSPRRRGSSFNYWIPVFTGMTEYCQFCIVHPLHFFTDINLDNKLAEFMYKTLLLVFNFRSVKKCLG